MRMTSNLPPGCGPTQGNFDVPYTCFVCGSVWTVTFTREMGGAFCDDNAESCPRCGNVGLDAGRENIERLANIHIARFRGRLKKAAQGFKGIDVDECRAFLSLWRGIEAKGYAWKKLSKDERREVFEAVLSGE